jgi:hypothetical protein
MQIRMQNANRLFFESLSRHLRLTRTRRLTISSLSFSKATAKLITRSTVWNGAVVDIVATWYSVKVGSSPNQLLCDPLAQVLARNGANFYHDRSQDLRFFFGRHQSTTLR